MKRILIYIILFFNIINGCKEPYDFNVENESTNLVIESMISNKSYLDTKAYPSDGRYFTVKLSLTNSVKNTRPAKVNNAEVRLEMSDSSYLEYTPSGQEDGLFYLEHDNFKAKAGIGYRLKVIYDEVEYTSSWQYLPKYVSDDHIDTVSFDEVEKDIIPAGSLDNEIVSVNGIMVKASMGNNTVNNEVSYYRWKFQAMWVFKAAMVGPEDPNKVCWVTDKNYLNGYVMGKGAGASHEENLFFVQTHDNEKIYYDYSVLIIQEHLNKPTYDFWLEMQQSIDDGLIPSAQPYNLPTNFSSKLPVNGFFSVVGESAYRWYFKKSQLSYYVEDDLRYNCIYYKDLGPYAETCLSCLAYSGSPTTRKPSWWKPN
ncbi:DUF4249 domain-containing protein [Fulvivirga sediminis]|uniref:DUF4249 domain-containing protein n=1 Tax=Fulvivirga sediminis TaxID=2803949 RepID=A0A937F6A8_9BACT|nr:DUF4249 domain-containing protein [Fulvivirga sediminis]MBL3654798.1 DUF4249 domain-containing protein [Fulvivirga sediminis]